MKKILILCPYPEGVAPSQRLKFEQYYTHFRDAGYQVTVSPFISKAFWSVIYRKGHFFQKAWYTLVGYARRTRDLARVKNYDIVYIHLWVTPFGPPIFERWICNRSRKVIFDIDDLVYLPGVKSDVNPLISGLKGKNKPIFLMKRAHHVITCTPYLDEIVRRYNKHTTDISSTINTERYRPKTDYSIKGKAVLGWSGSVSTIKHLRVLEPVLRKLKADGLCFKLLVMGDESFSLDGLEVEALPWKESHEVEVIKRFDIGLYPLPDEQWVYGKSGLKAIQYMAAGVPVIATAIGTNFRIIENNVNGFLVSSDEEWLARLRNLIADENLRKRLGRKGAEFVEGKFSINANKATYLSIVKEVLSEP